MMPFNIGYAGLRFSLSSLVEEGSVKFLQHIPDLDSRGQGNLQAIFFAVIVSSSLLGIAWMLPKLSTVGIIGLTAGMVIFIVCFASTEMALYALIFSMLLSPEFMVGATGGSSLSRGVTLRLDDFMLAIIGFSWFAKMSINKELGLFLKTPLNAPIGFYIIVCLVSTLYGSLFGRVNLLTGFFFVLKYFEYMIIYFMVANHITRRSQINSYLWAILLTGVIVSLVAMFQIPGGGRVSAPFEGQYGEPNTLGGYLVFIISLTIGLFVNSGSFRDRLIYLGMILLFIIPFFYTQSRSSYLAMGPAVMVFIWLSEKRNLIVGILLIIAVCLPFIAPQAARDRVAYTFSQGKHRNDVVSIGGVKLDTSTTARINSWKDASKDWINHPFLGYGVTGYKFVDAQYIRVITETGVIGLITFFALLITVFKQVNHILATTTDRFYRGLTMGFLAGYVGILVHALGAKTFIIVRIMEPFWFVVAMVFLVPKLEAADVIGREEGDGAEMAA